MEPAYLDNGADPDVCHPPPAPPRQRRAAGLTLQMTLSCNATAHPTLPDLSVHCSTFNIQPALPFLCATSLNSLSLSISISPAVHPPPGTPPFINNKTKEKLGYLQEINVSLDI